MKTNFILYVRDQKLATEFYSAVLAVEPSLNVPGMTEFRLGTSCVLGLMPEQGIKRLLGDSLPDPAGATGVPRAELYLTVEEPQTFHARALCRGAKELSPVLERNWGDRAGYFLDTDGHVVAFAKSIQDVSYEQISSIDINSSIWNSLLDLDREIFGEHHAAGLKEEFSRKHSPTAFAAIKAGKVVGYKMGYERKPNHYYSWLGGVQSGSRRLGIATALTKMQHQWCKDNGYKAIRTQTKNKWREMILLNIKSGFQIIGTFTDDEGQPKIMLEKIL